MIKRVKNANLYLKLFALRKIPLIFFCRPKVIKLTNERIEIKIPLRRRTRNHLKSMYFGAMTIGADIAGGFIAMMICEKRKLKVSLAFKHFEADFLKRPEDDVHFICEDGELIEKQINESLLSGERINQDIRVSAFCPKVDSQNAMAEFILTLSLKVKE